MGIRFSDNSRALGALQSIQKGQCILVFDETNHIFNDDQYTDIFVIMATQITREYLTLLVKLQRSSSQPKAQSKDIERVKLESTTYGRARALQKTGRTKRTRSMYRQYDQAT
jgi:hypothetical protein